MLWITILFFVLHSSQAVYKGTSIMCDCNTTHCKAHNMKHCNTTSMCFSQFLNRHDGYHPITRGCIKSKTPLLCENRRPAIAKGDWPLLLCCNSNLCNRDVVPTAPPWFVVDTEDSSTNSTSIAVDKNLGLHEPSSNFTSQRHPNNSDTSSSDQVLTFEEAPLSFQAPSSKGRPSSLPHIISPIYISVLVLGIISLIIIGIVAAVVLKRSNRYYIEQYGALEHQHDLTCLKRNMTYPPPTHVMCDCDSQVESLSQCSQSYVQVVYPNGESNEV